MPFSKISHPNIRNNYFSFYIIFTCFYILTGRFLILSSNDPLLVPINFLLILLPLIIIIFFALKSDFFVWLYVLYAVGRMITYGLNSFVPGKSTGLSSVVALEELTILILYLRHLKRYHTPELIFSWNRFLFWSTDFDKKQAYWTLMPFLCYFLAVSIVILSIIFKFRSAIAAKIFRC